MMKKISCFLIAVAVMASTAGVCFAALTISARPTQGGYDLQFDRLAGTSRAISKEVAVSVSSDLAKQYQVVQALVSPMTTSDGRMVPAGSFLFSAVSGSNSSGRLLTQQRFPVSSSRTIIYTSSPQGLSDSFRLVFTVQQPVPQGSYRGRIAFTVEPLGSSSVPVTAVMNVFIEVSGTSEIEIKTSSNSSIITLDSSRSGSLGSQVDVRIKGAIGKQFRIAQVLVKPFETNEGEPLDAAAVNYQVKGAKRGTVAGTPQSLSSRPDMVYTSGPFGESDEFTINFGLADTDALKAGRYRGRLAYMLETSSGPGEQLLASFDFEVVLSRTFDLVVTPQNGGAIEFKTAPGNTGARPNEVLIEIHTNIGKRYQVNQRLLSELVNRQGQPMPEKFFTLSQESVDTKGTLKFPEPRPVKSGDTTIFVSDRKGSPDKFKVVYALNPGTEVPAGDYTTSIMYTISEI